MLIRITLCESGTITVSGVGVRLEVGINIEKMEGVGSGEGLCPPHFGSGGLPRKKRNQFCAKNYAILGKFWYFFPIIQHKVGDYPPVLEVGDLFPCPPCSDAYGYGLVGAPP